MRQEAQTAVSRAGPVLLRTLVITAAVGLSGCGGGGGGGSGSGGGTGGPGPGDTEGYFRAEVGDTWSYSGLSTQGSATGQAFLDERRVTGTPLVDGVVTSAFQETEPYAAGDPFTDFISVDADGVWQRGGEPQDPLQASMVPYRVARFPLSVGAVESKRQRGVMLGVDLDDDSIDDKADLSLNVRMSGFETLQLEAGTFPDSARFVTTLSGVLYGSGGGRASFSVTETSWFAPDIGLAKQRTDTTIGSQRLSDVLELRGYALGDRHRGLGTPWIIAGDLEPGNSDVERPGRPAIASDGTNFLVVTRSQIGIDITTPIVKFIGLLVDPHGGVSPPIDINVPGLDTVDVTAAYGGGVYAVVFQDEDFSRTRGVIRLQRLTADGTVLEGAGREIPVGDRAGGPSLAFGSGVFLVVYNRYFSATYQSHVYGMLIAPDGTILGSGEFPIADAPGNQMRPRVAFDGANFLVVWTDTASGNGDEESFDIAGTRVSPSGVVLDPALIRISTAPSRQERPDVAGSDGQFLVAWQDGRNHPGSYDRFEIRAARVTGDGVLLDGPPDTGGLVANALADTDKHNAMVGACNVEYLVAWALYSNPDVVEPGIRAARVTRAGTVLPAQVPGIVVSGRPSGGYPRADYPSIAAAGDTCLMVWENIDETFGAPGKAVRGGFIYPFPP